MELLQKSNVIKLRSHNDRYLVADDDQETVRQHRNGHSAKARWFVDTVDSNSNVILLRSCHGTYLTASDNPFLLGMTGKRVTQSSPEKNSGEANIQWEPSSDGSQVRFRSWSGKFLRANGGTPPWRNSITHDDPLTISTRNWILWNVVALGQAQLDQFPNSNFSSNMSSFCVSDNVLGSMGSSVSSSFGVSDDVFGSMGSSVSSKELSGPTADSLLAGMEFFRNAKVVRLRSHHDKYLHAAEDKESVTQDRKGSSKNDRWTVEFVLNSDSMIRLKSCYGKYLTASTQPILLGVSGLKVVQSLPDRLDSSVEWEPVGEGTHVKLQTPYGKFLRANGGLPPWRNLITYDVPYRTSTQDWILWDVDVVETQAESDADKLSVDPISHIDHLMNPRFGNSPSSSSVDSDNYSGQEVHSATDKLLMDPISDINSMNPEFSGSPSSGPVNSSNHSQEEIESTDDKLPKDPISNINLMNPEFGNSPSFGSVSSGYYSRQESVIDKLPMDPISHIDLMNPFPSFRSVNSANYSRQESVTDVLPMNPISRIDSMNPGFNYFSSFGSLNSVNYSRQESIESDVGLPLKSEGRTIYYHIADENGVVKGESFEGLSFNFMGNSLEELTRKLENETGMESIVVCSRSPLIEKLFPLRLQLPPNSITMQVVVVPTSFWPIVVHSSSIGENCLS